MSEICLWCRSPNVECLIQTTEGRHSICKSCHRAMRKRNPRRTRSKSQPDLRQPLFPFMSINENGSVLGNNIRAGRN
jgi:hypothetical protein